MTGNVTRLIFICFFACSVIVGCRGDSRELAETKIELDLSRTQSRYNALSMEKRELTLANNQLQEQVRKLSTDRDDVLDTSQQVNQSVNELNNMVNEFSQRIALLDNEIVELNLIIEEQEITIAEQEATIAELLNLSEQPVYEEQEQNYQDIEFAY
jgi:uncharacterized protein YoxC